MQDLSYLPPWTDLRVWEEGEKLESKLRCLVWLMNLIDTICVSRLEYFKKMFNYEFEWVGGINLTFKLNEETFLLVQKGIAINVGYQRRGKLGFLIYMIDIIEK